MTIHETINLDAREVYEEPAQIETAIGHSPLCDCEGCENIPPFNGYADREQQEYYAALQKAHDALFHCEDCGECRACLSTIH